MKEKKRIFFCFCMLLCTLLLFRGQAIYAAGANSNQVSSNSIPTSAINWATDFIKLVGSSLLGIIVALTGIYKFVLEKDYDIENIEINLINKKLPQNIKYTDFVCEKIFNHSRIVKKIDYPNPYYLDISIKITTPNGRKALNDIVIKKMVIKMNEYKFLCIPKNKETGNSSKCPFNKQKGEERCEILLEWPAIKEKDDRIALNPTTIFRNPDCLNIYLIWYPLVILSSVFGFIFPKKQEVVFEKMKHENGSSRIGIRSIGIFKGKRIDG